MKTQEELSENNRNSDNEIKNNQFSELSMLSAVMLNPYTPEWFTAGFIVERTKETHNISVEIWNDFLYQATYKGFFELIKKDEMCYFKKRFILLESMNH